MSVASFTSNSSQMHVPARIADISDNPPVEDRESDWWIELITVQPSCKYYFGAYESEYIAREELLGFVEDLVCEGAQGLLIKIQSCNPMQLTVDY